MESPYQNYWFVDSAADVHMYNNKSIMTVFQNRPTKVVGSILDRVLPGRGTVCLRLELEDGSAKLILNLKNVYYLLNSSYNLASLELLNNSNISHNNKCENLYEVTSKRVLAQAKR